jgi:hypothetical protein
MKPVAEFEPQIAQIAQILKRFSTANLAWKNPAHWTE